VTLNLTDDLDLQTVELNQRVEYLVQMRFFGRTDRQTHMRDRLRYWTGGVISKMSPMQQRASYTTRHRQQGSSHSRYTSQRWAVSMVVRATSVCRQVIAATAVWQARG